MTAKVFTRVNVVAWIAAISVLVFLFLFPHQRISAFEQDMELLCNGLEVALRAEEWEEALGLMESLQARFRAEHPCLRLFFDHEDVDELELGLKTAASYLKQEDAAPALGELEKVRAIASYLTGIETFTLTNLF